MMLFRSIFSREACAQVLVVLTIVLFFGVYTQVFWWIYVTNYGCSPPMRDLDSAPLSTAKILADVKNLFGSSGGELKAHEMLRQARRALDDRHAVRRALTGLSAASRDVTALVVLRDGDPVPRFCGELLSCLIWQLGGPALPSTSGVVGRGAVSFGYALNRLVAACRSAAALVAIDLQDLDGDQLLALQRRLASVSIVGAATVDPRGLWRLGCWETNAFHWRLRVNTASLGSWQLAGMPHCDDIAGPLLMRTSLLRSVPFLEENYRLFTIMRSWFLLVKSYGANIVLAPEVSFEIGGTSKDFDLYSKETWAELASHWHWNSVEVDERTVGQWECHRPCKPREMVKHWLLPPCCLGQLTSRLAWLFELGRNRSLPLELIAGNVLAAVKFGSQLPWDFDVDIGVPHTNMTVWKELLPDAKFDRPYYLGSRLVSPGYYNLAGFSVDLAGDVVRLSTIGLPDELRNVPTLARIGDAWLDVPVNPGRYARRQYGPECLRHMPHWRQAGYSGPRREQMPAVPRWPSCPLPVHHACLQNAPLDGSLLFK